MQSHVNGLTIAGFDPSSGAGLNVDIRVMEYHRVYPLSVCTSVTIQNSNVLSNVKWLKKKFILKQLNILFDEFEVKYAKIGLIKNIKHLDAVTKLLAKRNTKIIWDPIIKSSSGFNFYGYTLEELYYTMNNIFMITPNIPEAEKIFGTSSPEKIQYILYDRNIASMVLLKGGHAEDHYSCDYLISKSSIDKFETERIAGVCKHGTGCVLSTSILCNLANGIELKESIIKAKEVINKFLVSSNNKTGYFYYD